MAKVKSDWAQVLTDAVNLPGSVLKAYSAFHNYSIGNQMLALFQCHLRGLPVGPINTYNRWLEMGRQVRKGEKALTLCMPITMSDKKDPDKKFQIFVERAKWFTLAQTDGPELEFPELPTWDKTKALEVLGIEQVPFELVEGNTQGYAQKGKIAISPLAQVPMKTLFHELGHVVLKHVEEHTLNHAEMTPRDIREAEAEATALLCLEALNLEGVEYCRGYIQNWLKGGSIPEKSAQKIFKSANLILGAGK